MNAQPAPEAKIIAWRRNPAVRAYPFDARATGEWLLELDDAKGRTQRLTVSTRVFEVLESLRQPTSRHALRERLYAEGWEEDRLVALDALLFGVAAERRILIREDAGPAPAPAQPDKPRYLSFMLRLLSPGWVNPVARPLSRLFSPIGLCLALLAAVVGQALLLTALLQHTTFGAPTSAAVLLGTALTLAVLLGHEFGHAAAAWRLGARRVSIGVGWYVLFPVAYADLSEVWRAPARSRALVDVAGILVQAVLVLALMLGYHASGSGLLLGVATAASLSILWNLNPLLRLDGYWLLSDLLGVPDLRRSAHLALRQAWSRMRGRFEPGAESGLPPRLAAGLALYALVSVVFLLSMLGLALTRFIQDISATLPGYFRSLVLLDPARSGIADLVVLVGGAAWHLLVFVFLTRFLGQSVLNSLRWLRRRVATGTG